MESSHLALGQIWVSQTLRGGWGMSRVGISVPVLALKSPHRIVSS
jgi:hypothetical protein